MLTHPNDLPGPGTRPIRPVMLVGELLRHGAAALLSLIALVVSLAHFAGLDLHALWVGPLVAIVLVTLSSRDGR